MRTIQVTKSLGGLTALFSLSMLPPAFVSMYASDGMAVVFALSFLFLLALGFFCWLPYRARKEALRLKDGFLIVVLCWVVLSFSSAIPLLFLPSPSLSFVDAIFESVSGLTTTGATVLQGIDDLPLSMRYYRQQLQWIGGMGIVVLAVAVMPMLGVGGMQLYRAETPGPNKDQKLTPKIKETAKALWSIYFVLTALCAVSYFAVGMSPMNAVLYAFSTTSIGGFAPHDASLGFFDSSGVYLVATLFMILSGLNFALHFAAWSTRQIKVYLSDPEAKYYFSILAATSLLVIIYLGDTTISADLKDWTATLMQTISIITTTGFTTEQFSAWPLPILVLLILLSSIGGCAGSTSGGIKVIRSALLYRQGAREIVQIAHPHIAIPIKFGGKAVSEKIVNAVWGFLALYLFSYLILFLAMLFVGVDLTTAFSSVSACLNNLGPGIGSISSTYSEINSAGKGILIVAMLLGRLELFTLLVLLSPSYWRW